MEYYHFFVDAWRFFKRYKSIAVNTQEFYDSVLEAAEKVTNRYGEHRLNGQRIRVVGGGDANERGGTGKFARTQQE